MLATLNCSTNIFFINYLQAYTFSIKVVVFKSGSLFIFLESRDLNPVLNALLSETGEGPRKRIRRRMKALVVFLANIVLPMLLCDSKKLVRGVESLERKKLTPKKDTA